MFLSQVLDYIYTWATGEAAIPAIWENPNAPRPALPYLSLHIMGIVRTGGDYISPPDVNGESKIISNVLINTTISCFYNDDASKINGMEVLNDLRMSLQKESVKQYFNENDLAVIKLISSVQDITTLTATGYEQRSVLDIQFATATFITDDVGLIEHVQGTGDVQNGRTINYEV